ncbi:MAG: cellulose biosynthesis cyclic di-GMP-binding regulatory protein BcsB [Myxococcota bacterium]|nr:cellulose biosynthesis cyclic di-GMP-binding regulatory protein BcsB [Myxococcota bacterium]
MLALIFLLPAPADARRKRKKKRKPPAPVEEVKLVPGAPAPKVRDISVGEDLGRSGDITLVGINGYNSLSFGLPEHWKVEGNPVLHLELARSAQLMTDISALTVWADGRPVGTVPLDNDPAETKKVTIELPIGNESGYHSIAFMAYHRSRLPCELSDHPGLWSRVLASSFIRVRYTEQRPELALSKWPYPFRDEKDPDPSRVVLVVPEAPSQPEVQAAGYIASLLGHVAGWRPMDLHLHQGALSTAPPGHLIAVSQADKPSQTLTTTRDALGSDDQAEIRDAARAIEESSGGKAGVLALTSRPGEPSRALLSVVGSDGPGLIELARLLSGDEARKLPVGIVEYVHSVSPYDPLAQRDWTDTVPIDPTFTIADLGLSDRMTTGYRGGRVTVPLHLVPDDQPIPGSARLELYYSYSAQADTEHSRLDVFLNGAAAGGVALSDVNGRNRVKLLLELPVHEMGPESRLDIDFTLISKEELRCLGDSKAEMWGTVHADSVITLPRNRWSYVPDLGQLRFGGFPFGLRADYGETAFVMAEDPSRTELQFYTWLAAELGRVSRGDRFAYDVVMGAVEQVRGTGKHVILVDSGQKGALIERMGLLDSMSFSPQGSPGVSLALASGGAVGLGADPKVAYIEQMALPWDPELTGIVAYAADATLFERVGRCLDRDSLFDRLRGRVTRASSCSDLAAIPAVERQILGERPLRSASYEPIRDNYWLLVAGVALGVLLLLIGRGVAQAIARRRLVGFDDGDLDES